MWLTVLMTTLAAVWGTGQTVAFREVTPPPAASSDPITGSLRAIRDSLNDIDTRVTTLGG